MTYYCCASFCSRSCENPLCFACARWTGLQGLRRRCRTRTWCALCCCPPLSLKTNTLSVYSSSGGLACKASQEGAAGTTEFVPGVFAGVAGDTTNNRRQHAKGEGMKLHSLQGYHLYDISYIILRLLLMLHTAFCPRPPLTPFAPHQMANFIGCVRTCDHSRCSCLPSRPSSHYALLPSCPPPLMPFPRYAILPARSPPSLSIRC